MITMKLTYRLFSLVCLIAAVLRADTELVKLGLVEQGKETTFNLVYKNTASAPIVLASLESSCPCVRAVAIPEVVEAGETITITCIFLSSNAGKIDVGLRLATPDAKQDSAAYKVSGYVMPKDVLITPEDASRRQATGAVIIDTRSLTRFEDARIPRSINIPSFALKTRTELRAASVVLVDEGYAPEVLLTEVANLQRQGFQQVQVMQGGIPAWARQGNALEGNRTDIIAISKISAADFARASATTNWRVVEWEGPKSASALAEAHVENGPLLISASAESDYFEAEKHFRASPKTVPIYFLIGGRAQLTAFRLQQTALAANSGQTFQLRTEQRATLGSTGGCDSCPK